MPPAFITGASRGIGKATARLLWEDGFDVVIGCHSRMDLAEAFAQELNTLRPHSALAVCGDVGNVSDVERMFCEIEAHFSPVEILVNNAAIAQQKLFTDLTNDDWHRMFSVSVDGMFYCCRRAVPAMIRAQKGSIVNLSSMWGMVGGSCEVHYSAAKGAIIAFTKALAAELGPSNIRVHCVAPGVLDTAMHAALAADHRRALAEETPLCRIGTATEAAQAVRFLCSERASFITGQVLAPNGGIFR